MTNLIPSLALSGKALGTAAEYPVLGSCIPSLVRAWVRTVGSDLYVTATCESCRSTAARHRVVATDARVASCVECLPESEDPDFASTDDITPVPFEDVLVDYLYDAFEPMEWLDPIAPANVVAIAIALQYAPLTRDPGLVRYHLDCAAYALAAGARQPGARSLIQELGFLLAAVDLPALGAAPRQHGCGLRLRDFPPPATPADDDAHSLPAVRASREPFPSHE